MINSNKKWIILFFLLIGLSSCTTKPPITKEAPKKEEKIEIKKDPFFGVYCMDLSENPLKRIVSYSVELKKNMTARVIIFKKNKNKPLTYHGRYLFSKHNKDIIIIYFPKNVPSEFLLNNHDGTLSILDENQKPYKGQKAKVLLLRKIN